MSAEYPLKDYQIVALSEAVSIITHMSGTAGNEAIVAREPIVTSTGKRWVPFLSGNALRHRCIREPGALWLIDQYGLSGKLTREQLNFLLHGGNLTQSTAHENTQRIADFSRLFPLLSLVGACLPGQILKGSMNCWRGMLVCDENRQSLSRILPPSLPLPEGRLLSCEHMSDNYQYTRGDAAKSGLCPPSNEDAGISSLMIYSGQGVSRGSLFVHGFSLMHVNTLSVGALLHALAQWQESGGTIGGQASKGHGRLKTLVQCDNQDQMIADYVAYARSVKDEAIAWLYSVFPPVEERPTKLGKAKTAKAKKDMKPVPEQPPTLAMGDE